MSHTKRTALDRLLDFIPFVVCGAALLAIIAGFVNPGWRLALGLGANLNIAFGYVFIGMFIAPKFNLAASALGAKLARLAGVLFFMTCALTHFELAIHAMREGGAIGDWFSSWHGLIIHNIQAAAGWSFLSLAIGHLGVLIVNRDAYQHLVDERVAATLRKMQDRDEDYSLLMRDLDDGRSIPPS